MSAFNNFKRERAKRRGENPELGPTSDLVAAHEKTHYMQTPTRG